VVQSIPPVVICFYWALMKSFPAQRAIQPYHGKAFRSSPPRARTHLAGWLPPPSLSLLPTQLSHAVAPAAATAAAGERAGLPGRALRLPRRPRGRAGARGAPAPRVCRARRLAAPRRGAPRCRDRVLARALRRGPRRPPPRPVTRFVRAFAPVNSSEP